MKIKLSLIILGFILLSCRKTANSGEKIDIKNEPIGVVEVDSCEYIFFYNYYGGNIIHKQNCKYCKQRIQCNNTKAK